SCAGRPSCTRSRKVRKKYACSMYSSRSSTGMGGSSGPASGREAPGGQPGDEGRVLGRGEASFQGADQPVEILADQRLGIEPQAREDLGAEDPVGPRPEGDEASVATDKPEDLVGVQGVDHIFEDSGPLVVRLLRAQIDLTAGLGDLDD